MKDKDQIRVMVADPSSLARLIISDILNAEPGMVVVGTAADGEELVANAMTCSPQVIVLDADLPRNARNTALHRLMARQEVALVLSGYEDRQYQKALSSLGQYRMELLSRPKGIVAPPLRSIAGALVDKVRRAAGRAERFDAEPPAERVHDIIVPSHVNKHRNRRTYQHPACLVVIGSSTGGNTAVEYILGRMQPDFAGAILVAQHMPPGFSTTFARRLNAVCPLEVKEARNGDLVEAGRVLIAPGEMNLVVNNIMGSKDMLRVDGQVEFADSSPYDRPSIDMLMQSAAQASQVPVLGIILSGMGRDGTSGARAIREKDGSIWVQDPASAAVFGMGKAVLEDGSADKVLPLSEIPRYLDYHVRQLLSLSQLKMEGV